VSVPTIALFTDFGIGGPYVGQVHAALARLAPAVPVFDLMADAPRFDARRSSYLLAALVDFIPPASIVLGVVDPGVGSDRAALAIEADGRWFVGPDNGLFSMVARRANRVEPWKVDWIPPVLSASFHGRDLFAPVAARIASDDIPNGEAEWCHPCDVGELEEATWPDDLAEVVYIDAYGNAVTGIRGETMKPSENLFLNGIPMISGRTFSDVSPGSAFCYENANGLLEIAVNMGSAADDLGISVGCPVEVRAT